MGLAEYYFIFTLLDTCVAGFLGGLPHTNPQYFDTYESFRPSSPNCGMEKMERLKNDLWKIEVKKRL